MSDGTHECPWPDCTRRVGHELWGCSTHWFRLPGELRAALGRAWRHGTPAEHMKQLERIDDWMETHA